MTESLYSNSIVTEQDLEVLEGAEARVASVDGAVKATAARSALLLVAFVCTALVALNVWLEDLQRFGAAQTI